MHTLAHVMAETLDLSGDGGEEGSEASGIQS